MEIEWEAKGVPHTTFADINIGDCFGLPDPESKEVWRKMPRVTQDDIRKNCIEVGSGDMLAWNPDHHVVRPLHATLRVEEI